MASYPWSIIATARAYDRILPYWSRHRELSAEVVACMTAARRVLDAGCGSGIIAERLAKSGACVEGIDFNPEMIRAAEERVGRWRGTLRFSVGDAAHLSCADATFDGAVSTNVVFAVPEPLEYLLEIRRALRSGGVLAVSGPTPKAAAHVETLIENLRDELERTGRASFLRDELAIVSAANRAMAAQGFGWTYTADGMGALLSDLGFRVETAHERFYEESLFFVRATRLG